MSQKKNTREGEKAKPDRKTRRVLKHQHKTAQQIARALHNPKRTADEREAIRRDILQLLAASNYLPDECEAVALITLAFEHNTHHWTTAAWDERMTVWMRLLASAFPKRHKANDEAKPAAAAAPDETETRIGELRRRLDSLTDITDTTERFKVERAIYDLEATPDDDEWPEVIDA